MPNISALQPIKVAIYFDLVAGRSARETAARYSITHPTAVKYADEALTFLRTIPAVVTSPELSAYMADSIKKQVFGFTPELNQLLSEALQPYLSAAATTVIVSNTEPTLTISAKVPESIFYRFKRLVAAQSESRGVDMSISGLLAELITSYVETGIPPAAEATFDSGDAIMDEIRQLLAKHGIVKS